MRGKHLDQEPERFWTVPAEQGPIRVDVFVRGCVPHLSLRQLRKAIDEGEFWLHDKPARKGEKLSAGDVVTFKGPPDLLGRSPVPQWDLKVGILYEDESILLVDKPAGMPVHGFSGNATHTLANFLAAERPSVGRVGRTRWEPGIVHRIDRDTSGIVLIVKEPQAFENLRQQFRDKTIQKRYWALVWGRTKRQGVITYPLTHDRSDRRKMKWLSGGEETTKGKRWPAVTRFYVVAQSQRFSFLMVEIETGVTHQIRAHLAAVGYPLVGDPLYGGDRPRLGLDRQFLHAFYLGLRHPKDGREVSFECALPQDLKEVLDRLKIKV